MKRKIFNILLLFTTLFVGSCSEDLIFSETDSTSEGGIPVEFLFDAPDLLNTRGVDNPKTSFGEGDMLHVSAVFYDKDDVVIKKEYRAFQLTGGKWEQSTTGEHMYWPSNSKRGEFKAYFVDKVKVPLEAADIPKIVTLSELEDATDPLYAEANEKWGHKINLYFSHLCTHLTFTNLDPDITDYFWLVNRGDENFKNKFRMWLDSERQLQSEFYGEGDTSYDGLVYVQRKSENLYDNNGVKNGSQVRFFLYPGDYSYIELRTINNYPYLSYKSESTSNLEANKAYVIDIIKNKGVTYLEEEDDWHDDDDITITVFEPEKFLRSIAEGTDYTITEENGYERTIIQTTPTGSILKYNVDFQFNKEYVDRLDFTPNVPTGRYFDGGNHFIYNLATNLFTNNFGTIRHLGLKNVKCEVKLKNDGYIDDSRWGVLCKVNSGLIENVRLETVDVKFNIEEHDSQHVFNMGSLVGSNSGTISEVEYGNIKLETSNQDVSCTINFGGIIGQSTGYVKEISPIDENKKIEIINAFHGDQTTFYVGGALGQTTTNIADVSLNHVIIDNSGASGLVGYTGGIAGRLRATIGTPSVISSCTVGGNISGIKVSPYKDFEAISYTGGISGYNKNFTTYDCRSVCNVSMNNTEGSSDRITYGVGGAFGRILSGENEISDNYILGSTLIGPENYTGNFTGLAPIGTEWSEYQAKGNVVRNLISGKYIGGNIAEPSTDE